MSRLLVSIFVPAVRREIDVYIPYEVPVGRTTTLIRSLLADDEMTGGQAVREAVLCDRETGAMLDPTKSPEEAGLKNASRLLLV